MGFTNKEDNFMSVVAYVHNDGQDALTFVKNVSEVLDENFKKYEILFRKHCFCVKIKNRETSLRHSVFQSIYILFDILSMFSL